MEEIMRTKQNYLLIERLGVLSDCIASGCYPSRNTLMNKIEEKLGERISLATLYRDIRFLRDRMSMNIQWDYYRGGYYIDK